MKSIVNDLSELVEHEVITNDAANAIRHYYQQKQEHQPNRLLTVFGVLGSALVGLGIILIVAHNWDNFSKGLKTMFAFLPLIIGQAIAGYSILKSKNQSWKESSGTFIFFAFGACMAMVSQIYNIPGDLGNYLLTWTLLGLPLIYVLNSNTIAVLSIVFATYYACVVGYSFGDGSNPPWWYLVLLLGTIPYYVKQFKADASGNITTVLNWLYTISLTIVLVAFIDNNWPLVFMMYAMLFGVFYNLGKTKPFETLQLRRNSFSVIGSLGIVVILMILTFNAVWKEILREQVLVLSQEWYISMLLFTIALLLLLNSTRHKQNKKFNLFQYAFLIFAFIFVIGGTLEGLGAVLSNILIVALGLFALKIGADSMRFSVLNYGLLIISTVIICRFFDTNMSFVLRGILFVLVGIGFFIANYLMLKKQKRLTSQS